MRGFPAIVIALGVCGAAVAGALADATRLPSPPWQRFGPSQQPPATRLTPVSSRPNTITDVGAWFRRNRLALPEARVPGGFGSDLPYRRLPAGAPQFFSGAMLIRAIRSPGRLLLVYGRDFASGRYLVARSGGRDVYALDFLSYVRSPRGGPHQSLVWADEQAGVLYVSHSHSTYASASRGLNGYVTAIDIRSRKVLWRTRPLVSNAQTFAIVGNVIVAGYGFTREPDFVYLLDRRTGRVVQRLAVPSGPEYIIRRGASVYVRTYDRDIVLRLRPGG